MQDEDYNGLYGPLIVDEDKTTETIATPELNSIAKQPQDKQTIAENKGEESPVILDQSTLTTGSDSHKSVPTPQWLEPQLSTGFHSNSTSPEFIGEKESLTQRLVDTLVCLLQASTVLLTFY